MTNETIYQFAMEAISCHSFDGAKNLVMRIILAANQDSALVEEAFEYVNDEFMEAAMNKNASNQSELI